MRSEVKVQVGGVSYTFALDGKPLPSAEQARAWLDAQFVALECEPLRASGKLLLADKVLVLAREAGAARFADAAWAEAYASAVGVALGRPTVEVDADAMSLNY